MNVLGALLFVFVTLKVAGVIAWSWWWVLAPAWAPFVLMWGLILTGGIALWTAGRGR